MFRSEWQPKPKIINQRKPNQHIILYNGVAELITDRKVIEGRAIIVISWHPCPNVNFKFTYFGEERLDEDERKNSQLKLTENIPQHRLKVVTPSYTGWGNGKVQYSGYLTEPFVQGTTEDLFSIVFHVTNFWWFNIHNYHDYYEDDEDEEGNETTVEREAWLSFDGQFIFEYENWYIAFSSLDNNYELEESLEVDGGFGITHICKLKHLDNTPFNLEQAYQIIEAFSYYLSFVRGIWVSPLLVSGFDREGNQTLEEWRNPIIRGDYWQNVYSWAYRDSDEIVAAFPGFMKKWQDEDWKPVIQNAIQWYIESVKKTSGYNTSIILTQAALEKLAWTYLNTNNCISANGFQKLTFDDRVRLLLQYLSIPIIELEADTEMFKFSKLRNCLDSIQATSEVRNLIVHPKIKQLNVELTETVMKEALRIALGYLLGCLLKLFEYPYSLD